MDRSREISMPHISQIRTCPPVAASAAVGLLALALACAALPARAADTPPKPTTDTAVKSKAVAPSTQVEPGGGAAEKGETTAQKNGGKRGESHVRFDTDDEFDVFLQKTPWAIGLIFLVVGSIFLTPVILLIGIIWYKLRKTRLQNEAMLALAERGVVPPAQAADALAIGTSAASVAPQVYQQAVAMRKRVVWSDLRKGVILSMIGLGLSFYAMTASGEPSWIGLILLFVGVGYVALWWLEGRHLEQAGATRAGNGAGTSSSGG
jgi:hypothetical protein